MLIYYLIFINIVTLLLFIIDKRKAIKKKWRISELTLLTSSFIGGSIGAMIGMYIFRHKTKHWKFIILIPLSMILHVILFIYFMK